MFGPEKSEDYELPKEVIPERYKSMYGVDYDDLHHTYQCSSSGGKLHSVTMTLGQYSHPFTGSTLRTQERTGMSHEEVLKMWEDNKNFAAKRGTYIHAFIEYMVNSGLTPFQIKKKFNVSDETYGYLKFVYVNTPIHKARYNQNIVLRPEIILRCLRKRLSGQADLLVEYPKYIDIYDWKTNRKDLNDWYNQYMRPPFQKMKQTSMSKFTLQLSTYASMAERQLMKPVRNLYIIHLKSPIYMEKIRLKRSKTIEQLFNK